MRRSRCSPTSRKKAKRALPDRLKEHNRTLEYMRKLANTKLPTRSDQRERRQLAKDRAEEKHRKQEEFAALRRKALAGV